MSEFLQQTLTGFVAMSYWEYIAVFFSVAYLWLALKQSLWCWPCAFLSTFIYTLLFWQGALLMESVLNLYYMIMAFYGWYSWHQGGPQSATQPLPISSWSIKIHAKLIIVTTVIALVIGYVLDQHTIAQFAYLDSLTTCFSVVTTYLVAKKVLENWIYWVFIDALSLYIFVNKGFYPTAVLFIFYTLIAIWGYIRWQTEYSISQQTVQS